MPERVSVAEATRRVLALKRPALIGIDGLPCSGKSTLVRQILGEADDDCIYLDDFVRPEGDWPSHDRPHFPFEYMRYAEFLAAVRALATDGECSFRPFDWPTLTVSTEVRRIELTKLVIVEGVSALNPDIADLYDLRIFVESDRSTVLAASRARGMGKWAREWEELFLPSADLYMATQPDQRADLLVLGRGV